MKNIPHGCRLICKENRSTIMTWLLLHWVQNKSIHVESYYCCIIAVTFLPGHIILVSHTWVYQLMVSYPIKLGNEHILQRKFS